MTVHLPGVPQEEIVGIIPAQPALEEMGIIGNVPIIETRWFDERQCCGRVHDFLAGELQGIPPDWEGCPMYRPGDGVCKGDGRRVCLFLEPLNSPGWERAKGWEYVDFEGSRALARHDVAAQIRAEKEPQP